MNEQEKKNRREPRRKGCRITSSVVFGNYALPHPPEDADEWWHPEYYLHYACTMGQQERYDHPDIEALITSDVKETGHSVISYLVSTIQNGARYAAGDRVEIPGYYSWQVLGTVEFRESRNPYGSCLRAVVLGIEEELQSLPYEEVDAYLAAYGPLYDPCEGL